MSGLGLGGLISGANTEDLIRKIMALEKERLYSRQDQQKSLEAKQKAWRDVRSSLSSLQSKIDSLRFASNFRARKVSLTDETVASITASSGAALTSYSLEVSTLAQNHVITQDDAATSLKATANEVLGLSGTFKIGLASTPAEDRKEIEVTALDTLNSLVDKINAADAGVRAHVVKVQINGEEKSRMVLTSSKTGEGNAVHLETVSGTALQDLGLSKELSKAQDASFSLNGISYKRESNVVSDAMPGLTITLNKRTTDPVQATVTLDADKVLQNVKGWVEAINSTQDLLKRLASYDAENKTGGVLNGDSMIRNLQTQIRRSISNVVSGLPATMNQMSQVGVSTGAYGSADYGKVIIDETKFKEAMEKNADGVAKLFGALQNNVALATAGATVTSTSTAADGTYSTNDLINGVTDSDRFGTVGGGWKSAQAPTAGAPQGFTVTFGAVKSISEITIYQRSGTGGMKDYTLWYQDATTDEWIDLKITPSSGSIHSFSFDPVNAKAVRLEATSTYGDVPMEITEFQVGEYNNGAAIDMYRYIRASLDVETGGVEARDKGLTKQIKGMRDSIDRIEQQLLEREERLRRQFARMEEAMSKLRSQGSAFAMQLMGMGSM